MNARSFENDVRKLMDKVQLALEETTVPLMLGAFNALVEEKKRVKKLTKESADRKIWDFIGEQTLVGKAEALLTVAEHIALEVDRDLRQSIADQIPMFKAEEMRSKADDKPKQAPAPKKEKAAKKEAEPKVEKAPTAVGRTGELVKLLEKNGAMSVDDLAKELKCPNQTVRNTIDAARRAKHIITAVGKGVFELAGSPAKTPAPEPAKTPAKAKSPTPAKTPEPTPTPTPAPTEEVIAVA